MKQTGSQIAIKAAPPQNAVRTAASASREEHRGNLSVRGSKGQRPSLTVEERTVRLATRLE